MRFKNYLIVEMSLDSAVEFATFKHRNQKRSGGEPYIVHPTGVFEILKKLKVNNVIILVASFLHDTLEDTNTTYNEIKDKFNKEVADLVAQLTSNSKEIDKMGKPEYLLQKMIKMSSNSLTIKLADRLHNLSDIVSVNKKFADKMWSQTTYIIKRLRTERVLNTTQKKLVRSIEKQLDMYKLKGSQYEI